MTLRARAGEIERLIDQLQEEAPPGLWAKAEAALAAVTEIYGAALQRIVDLGGPDLLLRLAADDLVGSLLVVHDLHPRTIVERIDAALDTVRPYLASHGGDVEIDSVTVETGTVALTLLGSCGGCPSSEATMRSAVEEAIFDAVPEITTVVAAPSKPPAAAGVPIRLTPTRTAVR